jgi:heme A synthase
MTHRTIAVLLLLHLIGMTMMLRKRRETEAPIVQRAVAVALGMVVLQLCVASTMILFHLPKVLRSLHEATGVGIWLSCFLLAYLARKTAWNDPAGEAILSAASRPQNDRQTKPIISSASQDDRPRNEGPGDVGLART